MRRTKALDSTAYHEAGHAVAAWHVGMTTQAISIIRQPGSLGRVISAPYFARINLEYDGSPRAQRKAENMALVSCAGPAAQRKFNPKGFRSYHARGDWRQAVDVLSYVAADNEVLEQYFKLIDLQARKLLNVPTIWLAIEAVAEALLEKQQIAGPALRKIIDCAARP